MKLAIVCSGNLSTFWREAARLADPEAHVELCEENAVSCEPNVAWVPCAKLVSEANFVGKRLLVSPANAAVLSRVEAVACLPLRHRPEILHLKQMAESGKLGQIGTVRISVCQSQQAPGALTYDDAPAHADALLQPGVHALDALRWCFGEVERVNAVQSTDGTKPALYSLMVAKLASGAIAHLECSLAEAAGGDYLAYEIAGANAILEYDSRKEPLLDLRSKTSHAASSVVPSPELVATLKAFLNDTTEQTPAPDAQAAFQLVQQAKASSSRFVHSS